jgi:hypothetical protein
MIILGLVILSGCVDTSKYTRNKPDKADLVGVWFLQNTDADNEIGKETRTPVARLTLNQDGSYSMSQMPSIALTDTATSPGKTISDSGQWSLDNSPCDADDCWWSVVFNSKARGSYSANICSEKPPYAIEFIIGDWDAGNFLYLSKNQ